MVIAHDVAGWVPWKQARKWKFMCNHPEDHPGPECPGRLAVQTLVLSNPLPLLHQSGLDQGKEAYTPTYIHRKGVTLDLGEAALLIQGQCPDKDTANHDQPPIG